VRGAARVLALALAFGLIACGGGGDHNASTPVRGPADVSVPRNPAAVAKALARVERALRAPATPSSEIDRLGWEQQAAYRALGAHPRWVDEIVRRLPADLRPVVTANEQAGRELQALGGGAKPPRQLPDWRIVPPLPAGVLRAYYGEAETASGIPWAYLAAIHLVETRLGRIQGTSSAGAQGPMQFIPATWARYGQGDINDNHDAILAAARFLQANGGPGDMDRALFRYNNSSHYVTAVEAYAQVMLTDERAFLGYHGWQVYDATTRGTFLLPEGYPRTAARKVTSPGG
jgi:hypothetical protein